MEQGGIDMKALARNVVALIEWAEFRKLDVVKTVRISSPQLRSQFNIALQRPEAPSTLSYATRLEIISIAAYEASQQFQITLGASFSDPSREELEEACDFVERQSPRYSLLCALTSTVLKKGKAQEHCARLLEERYSVSLPLEDVSTPDRESGLKPAEPPCRPPRARTAKKKVVASPPVISRRKKHSPDISILNAPPSENHEPKASIELPPITRWVPQLSPKLQAEGFDVNHPLVGSIVWADVLFHDRPGAKMRPSVVIAVKKSATIVRGLYSNPGPRRKPFTVWQHYDLDRLGSIAETNEFARALPARPHVIARLTDEHWNLLR
jgi:hypothetical protein